MDRLELSRKLVPAIMIVGLLGLAVFMLLSWDPGRDSAGPTPVTAPEPVGGDFVLQSADGPVDSKDYRGKLLVLYFGYTACPDICPTSLATLSMALEDLPEALQAEIQPIFISVDPERDTPLKLAEYGRFFHPSMLGVTGDPQTLRKLARDYGAAYHRVKSDSAMGYMVDHSADLYLVDRQGRLRRILRHGTSAAEIAKELRRLANESDRSLNTGEHE